MIKSYSDLINNSYNNNNQITSDIHIVQIYNKNTFRIVIYHLREYPIPNNNNSSYYDKMPLKNIGIQILQ
jgi:rRNA maturation protein Rpf1